MFQILSGVIALIMLVYLAFIPKKTGKKDKDDNSEPFWFKTKKNTAMASILLVLALFVSFGPFAIVTSGNHGLKFTLGKIENVELQPGPHFKIPFIQSIKSVSIQPIKETYLVAVGSDGAITKDNQTIGASIELFFVYKPGELVRMYQDYGMTNIKTILKPIVMETFKEEIGNYDIFVLPTIQDVIRKNIDKVIREKINSYPIDITEIKITNYDWSDDFDKQIAETMTLAQQVKQAEQQLLKTAQEAQQEVKKAEAAKTAEITKAEGDKMARITRAEGAFAEAELLAKAKAAEGRGIRDYNEFLKQNWAIELELRKLQIELERVNKWNGQYVPINHYGPIPFTTASTLPAQ